MFAERWTIDEIGDGVVRVLAARSLDPGIAAPLVAESRASSEPEVAEEARAEVMAIELGGIPDDDGDRAGLDAASAEREAAWTEEQDSVLDAAVFAEFIGRFRERVPGAVERPLRETDVFWVVADEAPARALSDLRVRRSETAALVAGYAAANPIVRDMTAQARQASKVLYHEAFRKSEEQS